MGVKELKSTALEALAFLEGPPRGKVDVSNVQLQGDERPVDYGDCGFALKLKYGEEKGEQYYNDLGGLSGNMPPHQATAGKLFVVATQIYKEVKKMLQDLGEYHGKNGIWDLKPGGYAEIKTRWMARAKTESNSKSDVRQRILSALEEIPEDQWEPEDLLDFASGAYGTDKELEEYAKEVIIDYLGDRARKAFAKKVGEAIEKVKVGDKTFSVDIVKYGSGWEAVAVDDAGKSGDPVVTAPGETKKIALARVKKKLGVTEAAPSKATIKANIERVKKILQQNGGKVINAEGGLPSKVEFSSETKAMDAHYELVKITGVGAFTKGTKMNVEWEDPYYNL